MNKYKNLILITACLSLYMPQASFADYKPVNLLTDEERFEKGVSTDNNGLSVIDTNSYYKVVSPANLYQNPVVKKTKTMKLLDGVERSLREADKDQTETALVLKKWNAYEPKIKSIIKKEKQLDELLDYMSRLKKVSKSRKRIPTLARNELLGRTAKPTPANCDPYQIPKCS